MFKKAIPLALVTGLALAGCGNNDVPKNNETPMQNLEDDMRDMTPKVNNGAGPDMDGVENGRDRGNGVNDGIINDDNRNNGTMDGMNKSDDGIMNDNNITDPNNTKTNRDQKNGMNNNR